MILRVALEGDQVHAFIATVLLVVLAFILRFGHNLNNLMTESLAIRYDNNHQWSDAGRYRPDTRSSRAVL